MHRPDHLNTTSTSSTTVGAHFKHDPYYVRNNKARRTQSPSGSSNLITPISHVNPALSVPSGVNRASDHTHAQSHAFASSTAPATHQSSSSPSRGKFAPFSRSSPSSPPSAAPASLNSMGQTQSTARGTPPSLSVQLDTSQASSSGPRLKLSWPIKRKRTLDTTSILAESGLPADHSSKENVQPPPALTAATSTGSISSSPVGSTFSGEEPSSLVRPRSRTSAKQLATQIASSTLSTLKGKFNASTTSVQSPASPSFKAEIPPPLPPKQSGPLPSTSPSPSSGGSSDAPPIVTPASESHEQPGRCLPGVQMHEANREVSALPASSPAAEVLSGTPTVAHVNSKEEIPRRREPKGDEQNAKEIVDDWRKSDSTLRTVRLVGGGGVPVGTRTPRPLSVAESTNSANTVQAGNIGGPGVGNAGKRQSALIMDADYGMPEVDSEDDTDEDTSSSMHEGSLEGSSLGFGNAPGAPSSNPGPVTAVKERTPLLSYSPSPQSSPCPSPKPSKISKLIKGARRASNSLSIGSSHRSLSPRRGMSKDDRSHDSDHEIAVSGSDSEVFSSISITGVPSANSSTTSVTSTPSQSSKDTTVSSMDSSAYSHHDYATPAASSPSVGNSEGVEELHPWVSTHSASESSASLIASTAPQSNNDPSEHNDRSKNLPSAPSSTSYTRQREEPRTRLTSTHSRGFRQTAVSLTNASAGFAKGFGRMAVDKLGKALSGSSTNLSTGSGSGTESNAPSSFTHLNIGRGSTPVYTSSGSDKESHPPKKKHGFKRGRTPNAPSGTWSVASSDSEAVSNPGPNLGYLVRHPLRPGQGGLVFGRILADSVRDTMVKPGTFTLVSIGKKQRRGSRSSLSEAQTIRARTLEDRRLPAVVARCAQHIEKWGVQEEGLFRVSGRATHVAKVRAEFDSGADYDMSECGPSELDPHAVASVFKAFLRELPEPILTRHLMPYFEEALHQENGMLEAEARARNQDRAQGAKGGLPQIRKPPSLSTFAVPTFMPRAPSANLVNALSSLIARLPDENRDLLRTVTELMSATAKRSKETKMPLSNLLLVFCPSLAMNPPLLRVLCEGEGIWDGPQKSVEDAEDEEEESEGPIVNVDAPSADQEEDNVDEDDSMGSLRPRQAISRGRIATIYLPNDSPNGPFADLLDDAATTNTDTSSDDRHSTQKLVSPASGLSPDDALQASFTSPAYIPYSPPPLTSSSESLNTPASAKEEEDPRPSSETTSEMQQKPLRAQSDLPSPRKVRKASIGNPVGITAPVGSAPVTPVELRPSLRLSTYSSSSPDLNPGDGSSKRKSKILHDLLPKRSLSSLLGRSPTTPESSRSFSSAHQTRISTAPPTLDFTLEQSPIKLGLGLDFHELEAMDGRPEDVDSNPSQRRMTGRVHVPENLVSAERLNSAASTNSNSSSVFYTPPTSSRMLAHAPSQGSFNSTGSYSLLEFGFDKGAPDETDGWAKSVLLAADDKVVR